MAEVVLSDNLTELLNLSGDCGVALSSEAVETINYYRYFFKLKTLCCNKAQTSSVIFCADVIFPKSCKLEPK